MKRYLIFGGASFYARGGFKDLIADADTVEQARAKATALVVETKDISHGVEWWQVVDLQTGETVAESEEKAHGAGLYGAEIYHRVFMGGYLIPEAVEVDE